LLINNSGDKWRIYPTYDYTHCLCDSFENITHSLCTTEFRQARESYYWLCDALEVYKPVQWEYGRLNITNTVLSKRKLTQLVSKGVVKGWDDPRLYTLVGLRRRGFPAEGINRFVRDCGCSTAFTTIDVKRLEYFVRQVLDETAPRVMAITRPLLVRLVNMPDEFYEELNAPFFPKNRTPKEYEGGRVVPLTNTLWIEREDFMEQCDDNFYRLSVGGTVSLLHVPHPIYCRSAIKNDRGEVVALECVYVKDKSVLAAEKTVIRAEPKAYIHWLALSTPSAAHPNRIQSPDLAEVRVYSDLFLHSNPNDKSLVPGGFLSDINPDSLHIYQGLVEGGLRRRQELCRPIDAKVQFVRDGYFCVDEDTKLTESGRELTVGEWKDGKLSLVKKSYQLWGGWCWNRTVGLKEDVGKVKEDIGK
jgi:glutaminyl-tRNA synthetase